MLLSFCVLLSCCLLLSFCEHYGSILQRYYKIYYKKNMLYHIPYLTQIFYHLKNVSPGSNIVRFTSIFCDFVFLFKQWPRPPYHRVAHRDGQKPLWSTHGGRLQRAFWQSPQAEFQCSAQVSTWLNQTFAHPYRPMPPWISSSLPCLGFVAPLFTPPFGNAPLRLQE